MLRIRILNNKLHNKIAQKYKRLLIYILLLVFFPPSSLLGAYGVEIWGIISLCAIFINYLFYGE